jgi:glutamate formiminotransferase
MLSCAIYLSTGAAAIASQVAAIAARSCPRVAVVDTFTDPLYARSSVKLVGHPRHLLAAVLAASSHAVTAIDLSREPHPAPHPRCGAIDLISFMPLSDAKTSALAADMAACDQLAWELGPSLRSFGCYVLMFGPRASRTLLETRRCTSFFSSINAASNNVVSSLSSDFGPADLQQTSGVTIVGAQAYVTNFNMRICGVPLEECKRAASRVRSEFRVQVMALQHSEAAVEIGCNLQATQDRDSPTAQHVLGFVRQLLPAEAELMQSYVVGHTPSEARRLAESALAVEQ